MDIKFDIVINSLPYLLSATLVTIKFTIISFIFALIIAFAVGILRSLKIPKVIDIIKMNHRT